MLRKEEVEKLGKETHDGKYTYILDKELYRVNDKIKCVCPHHGVFEQLVKTHLRGAGCRSCSQQENANKVKLTLEEFKEKSFKIHKGKYDESKVNYVNSSTKVCIICHEKDYNGKEHGEFWISPLHYLSGQGCKKCTKKIMTSNEFRDRCNEIFKGQGLNFENSVYVNSKTKIKCVCEKHGEFEKIPYQFLVRKEGCPYCSFEEKCEKSTKTQDEFIEDVRKVHGDKYDLSNVEYKRCYDYIYPVCHERFKDGSEHGVFKITPSNLLAGGGCPKCSRKNSKEEKEFVSFINSFDVDINESDRSILNGREIDVLIPSMNIGFEFDGLFWHSDYKKNGDYHLNKTNECKNMGIQLYHIFEDEWEFKQDIVKSKIKSILGKTERRIFARKCSIREIDSTTLKEFLNSNHLQGNVNSSHRYGLFYEDELVSVMSFGLLRKSLGSKNDGKTYELLRFCNKLDTSVVGGASKLLKHFINDVRPERIISYADKRWSNGNLYDKLGFVHIRDSKPNYYYINGHHRENRFKYRKDVLVREGFDPNKSERQIMEERGIHRIYDCGSMVFEMTL